MKDITLEKPTYKSADDLKADLVTIKSMLEGFSSLGSEFSYDEEITRKDALKLYAREKSKFNRLEKINKIVKKVFNTTEYPPKHKVFALIIDLMDRLNKDILSLDDVNATLKMHAAIFDVLFSSSAADENCQ